MAQSIADNHSTTCKTKNRIPRLRELIAPNADAPRQATVIPITDVEDVR